MAKKSSIAPRWNGVKAEQVEIAAVKLRFAYAEKLHTEVAENQVEKWKKDLKAAIHFVVEQRNGKLVSASDKDEMFEFLIDDSNSVENCCEAGLEILEAVSAINADIKDQVAFSDLERPIGVRILCDTGKVRNLSDSPPETDHLIAGLSRAMVKASPENTLTVTDRVYRQLRSDLQSQFASSKHSSELDIDLHSTASAEDRAGMADKHPQVPSSGDSPETPATPVIQPTPHDILVRAEKPWPNLGAATRRILLAIAGLAIFGFCMVLAYLVGRGSSSPVSSKSEPAMPDHAGEELVRSPEWMTWRRQVHGTLSDADKEIETSLSNTLRIKRPFSVHKSTAAALRHDQAVADVLLSYPEVRLLLRKRLGIDDQFLGTGLSNPANVKEYGSAAVHEYLIPNYSAKETCVLTRKLKPFVLELDKKVKDVVEEEADQDDLKPELTRKIASFANGKARGMAVIRFARLELKKYKDTLGHPDRVRVFASDLAEVWDLKLKDAAELSGYSFTGGDTFFLWIVVPGHSTEMVPATWAKVLDNLPEWLKEAKK